MMRRLALTVFTFLVAVVPAAAFQASAQDGFVPISELPPQQQLPAAPFVIAAYAFIWVAMMAYLWSIWRRLNKVEREMRALEDRTQKGSR